MRHLFVTFTNNNNHTVSLLCYLQFNRKKLESYNIKSQNSICKTEIFLLK